jgi:uncharacterized protein (DUF1015 family)
MADIQPLHGIVYNTDRVDPSKVLTQPYDKITPEMREDYLRASPYNLVRVELGKDEPGDSESRNKYTRARDLLAAWLDDGILRQSAQPALYYLEQEYESPDGSGRRTRHALVARVRLHRWDEGVILPHEHTLSKPKADRLSLLRTCGAQQGQIFMLYPTPKTPVSKLVANVTGPGVTPSLVATDRYGVVNRLWAITDPSVIATIQSSVRDLTFYIADGHHRYETALAYRDECRAARSQPDADAPSEFVMSTLVDMTDPGLLVLPTHRVVANLPGFDADKFRQQLRVVCDVVPVDNMDTMLGRLREDNARHVMGLADARGLALLRVRDLTPARALFQSKPPLWDELDVSILHVAILEQMLGIDEKRLRDESNVTYWRDARQAYDQVVRGTAPLAFFMRPTPVTEVKAIADARSRMPQKSTDFYPKLLSGMVMYAVR